MLLHPLASASAVTLVALSLGGCGGAPTDASTADFCTGMDNVVGALWSVEGDQPTEREWAAIQKAVEDLGETGTPSGIDDAERDGFEAFVEAIADLDHDEAKDHFNDGTAEDLPGLSHQDAELHLALLTFAEETCIEAARDEAAGAASDPALPDCASVWVEGEILPVDFAGCNDGDTAVETDPTAECDDGTSRLFYHRTAPGERDVELLAITGQKIRAYTLEVDVRLFGECVADPRAD